MVKRFGDERDWFFQKRFGMFVHWGLYAIPAWHEQILWRSKYKRKDYEKLIHEFNPRKFDPEQWLDTLQEAGMEYLCVTTKHHDGFCMWDTEFTEYSVMHTPYKQDIVGMIADACGKRGVRLGFYYSFPDWHHPHYPNMGRHHEMFGPRPGEVQNEEKYLEYVRNQVRELCTNYGKLYEFFWDVNVGEFHAPELNETVRRLQPQAVINDRGPAPGDYSTPERHVPEGSVFHKPTEACQSMGRESWGYREDEDYYSHKFLMQSMDKVLAMGGNYLLNVGPMADGTLPGECSAGLKRIGAWYQKVRESFCGTTPCSYMLAAGQTQLFRYDTVLLTRKGNTFYIHLCDDLQTTSVVLPGFDIDPEEAVLLNDGRSLPHVVDVLPWRWREKPCLRIKNIPVNEITGEVMVIKITFGDSAAE